MQQLLAKKMQSKNEWIVDGERWVLMIEVLNTTDLRGCWVGRGEEEMRRFGCKLGVGDGYLFWENE